MAVNRIERQSDMQAAERGVATTPARPDPEGGPDALKAAKHATTSRTLELGASTVEEAQDRAEELRQADLLRGGAGRLARLKAV